MWKKSIELATNIKLGTRVRLVEDGVEGRIVWANASAVKIQWDDGEKVTWKRAELGAKGLQVIDTDDAAEAPEPTPAVEPAAPEATPVADEVVEPAPNLDAAPAPQAESLPEVPAETPAEQIPEPASDTSGTSVERPAEPPTEAAPGPEATLPAKKRAKRTPTEPKAARPSALDAAARVLGEEMRPMNCQELIGVMAMKGYWTSPGGKTPAATLYSAILREMDTKGDAARFVKVGKGQFAIRPQA
jgi:HB1, ASXL, restriction endonuclease HTH domain